MIINAIWSIIWILAKTSYLIFLVLFKFENYIQVMSYTHLIHTLMQDLGRYLCFHPFSICLTRLSKGYLWFWLLPTWEKHTFPNGLEKSRKRWFITVQQQDQTHRHFRTRVCKFSILDQILQVGFCVDVLILFAVTVVLLPLLFILTVYLPRGYHSPEILDPTILSPLCRF